MTTSDRSAVIVAQGPPAQGGIASFAAGLVADRELAAECRLTFVNTTRRAERKAGTFTIENLRNAIEDARRVREAARSSEVVHIQTALLPVLPLLRCIALLEAARSSGAGVVVHVHSGRLNSGQDEAFTPTPLVRRLLRWLRRADEVVVVADAGADALRACAPGISVRTIHNAVDVAQFSVATVDHVHPTAVYVGTLSRRKGMADLIAALTRLKDRGITLPLRVVGGSAEVGDDEANELRAIAVDAELPVELLGPMEPDQVAAELQDADLFVLPSHWEGQPIAILEAMASGLPVVVTDVGANGDVIQDGLQGLLVPSHDPEALAGALQALAMDPQLRKRMGTAARRRIEEEYDRPRLRRDILRVYADAAAKAAGRRRPGARRTGERQRGALSASHR